jgi:transposase
MLADDVAFVLGVDTHADSHALALVDAKTQRSRRSLTIPATRRGYRQALRLARRRAPGRRAWALEGSGSYGAGLARFLAERGECVLEVERPARAGARARLKSDALDAERAARQVLAGTAGARPRLGAETQALRALLSTREGSVSACTAALNELRALTVTAPPQLRERLQGLSETALLAACARLRPGRGDSERAALALALRSLAQRVRQLRGEARTLEAELTRRVQALAPQLLAQRGVGPISAAALLDAWSQPGRLRSEVAFARLAGVAPIPANSGKTVRHRLDRGGDRRLNRALHTIILSRRRLDPDTKSYITAALARARASARRSAASSATSPAPSTEPWRRCQRPLDSYRSILMTHRPQETHHKQRAARGARSKARWAIVLALLAVIAVAAILIAAVAGPMPAEVATNTTGTEAAPRRQAGIVRSAAFSRDGRLVVTASDNGSAALWTVRRGVRVAVLRGHQGAVLGAIVSPDGKRVLTFGLDGTARLWALPGGRKIVVLRGHAGFLWSAAFSPDGKRAVTAGEDQTARVWALPSGRQLRVLRGHQNQVTGATFSPDGTRILTRSLDWTARLWAVASGRTLAVLRHTNIVTSASFSPNGKLIGTTSLDETARLWAASKGRPIAVLRGHRGSVTTSVFHPTSKLLATGGADRTVRLWNLPDGHIVRMLRGHTAPILGAAFSRDGTRLITASQDDTARVWAVASGMQVAVLRHADTVLTASFSPDGRAAATAGEDGTARLWRLPSGRPLAVLPAPAESG